MRRPPMPSLPSPSPSPPPRRTVSSQVGCRRKVLDSLGRVGRTGHGLGLFPTVPRASHDPGRGQSYRGQVARRSRDHVSAGPVSAPLGPCSRSERTGQRTTLGQSITISNRLRQQRTITFPGVQTLYTYKSCVLCKRSTLSKSPSLLALAVALTLALAAASSAAVAPLASLLPTLEARSTLALGLRLVLLLDAHLLVLSSLVAAGNVVVSLLGGGRVRLFQVPLSLRPGG